MLSAKKNAVTIETVRDYQRELEYLYARKTAIDSLIASREEYERFSAAKPDDGQRKTAWSGQRAITFRIWAASSASDAAPG